MKENSSLLTGLNELSKNIHQANKEKGFHDRPIEDGTLLMLCVSELSEALEALRNGKFSDYVRYHLMYAEGLELTRNDGEDVTFTNAFRDSIKNTFEDEIADTMIRLLDICGLKGIDIEKHIDLKLRYNKTRAYKHGKEF